MDKWSFGIAMTAIGVGGTFLALGILVVLTRVLKKIFPLKHDEGPSSR